MVVIPNVRNTGLYQVLTTLLCQSIVTGNWILLKLLSQIQIFQSCRRIRSSPGIINVQSVSVTVETTLRLVSKISIKEAAIVVSNCAISIYNNTA